MLILKGLGEHCSYIVVTNIGLRVLGESGGDAAEVHDFWGKRVGILPQVTELV